jgi:hypothetical protein
MADDYISSVQKRNDDSIATAMGVRTVVTSLEVAWDLERILHAVLNAASLPSASGIEVSVACKMVGGTGTGSYVSSVRWTGGSTERPNTTPPTCRYYSH